MFDKLWAIESYTWRRCSQQDTEIEAAVIEFPLILDPSLELNSFFLQVNFDLWLKW
jgi:hypothetical protein